MPAAELARSLWRLVLTLTPRSAVLSLLIPGRPVLFSLTLSPSSVLNSKFKVSCYPPPMCGSGARPLQLPRAHLVHQCQHE